MIFDVSPVKSDSVDRVIDLYQLCALLNGKLPALVAHLDARPTGDQEVADSTPAGSATFFRGDLIMKYFYSHSLPSADPRRAVVS